MSEEKKRGKNRPRLERDVPVMWMDKKELAQYVKLSIYTIDKYVCEQRVPFIKIPGSSEVRFSKPDIDEWMMSGRVATVREQLERRAHADHQPA